MSRILAPEIVVPSAVDAAEIIDAVREKRPLVQCLTNTVVSQFTANVLLSFGASPAMVDIVDEAGIFATVASSVLINVGTPHAGRRDAMREAAASAYAANKPWVLDPVAVGVLPVRTGLARELLNYRPSVIRGNASEVIALAGGQGGRGTDATAGVDSALDAASSLSNRYGSVVCISGPVDAIVRGEHVVRVANGSPLLTQVTGGGCALGAVVAACIGVSNDVFAGAVAAHVAYGMCAGWAEQAAEGPGSFAMHFVDALSAVDGESVVEEARLR